jgi:hypothetical protein
MNNIQVGDKVRLLSTVCVCEKCTKAKRDFWEVVDLQSNALYLVVDEEILRFSLEFITWEVEPLQLENE